MADRVTKVTLVAAAQQYISEMKRAEDSTAKVENQAAKTGAKLQEQHDHLQRVGAGIALVGAVATAAFAIAVKKFAEFDKAMSNVQAALQVSKGDMAQLSAAALEAGQTTVFSATEAASAIEELGKAGLSTKDILNGGLKGALSLAAAGQLSVADAAQTAAIAVKQFTLTGADLPHVADLLAAGAGKAVGDVSDLAQALAQTGLVAHGAGQSIEDTTGVLAAFADAGLIGSDAGTSLKQAIVSLEAPTTKAAATMKQYHLSFFDANGQMLSFEKIAGQLDDKLGHLTQQQRNSALATIFGTDALRVANVLFTQGADGIKKYITQTNDAGFAAKVAAGRLDNLSGDVQRLGGAIDTALIKSGSSANDSLRQIVQVATGIVKSLGSIPQPVLDVGLALTGLVAVVGLVGGAALIAIPKIAQFKTSLSSLNISGGSAARGIGLASGALAVAGTAFAVFASMQAEATATTGEFKDSLDAATGSVTGYTRELVAKKLAESGAFQAAKEAKISQKDLTDAVIAGGDAFERVKKKFEGNNTIFTFLSGVGFRAGNATGTINDLSGELKQAKQNLDDESAAAAKSSDKTGDAATAYKDAADKANELESNLRTLIDTINKANGVGQDAISANAQYRSALSGIADEVTKQKKAYEELHKTTKGFAPTLNQATKDGSANAAMLADVANKAQAAADAQYKVDLQTMDSQSATDKYVKTLGDQKKAFEDSAIKAGFNKDEVHKLGEEVFKLPDAKTIKVLASTAEATTEIGKFIADSSAKSITIGVRTYQKNPDGLELHVAGTRAFARAAGGILPGLPSNRDNMLIHAASGEFVTRASQTAIPENRRALEYINAGGVIRGYANGGFVQPQYASNVPRWSSGGGQRPIELTTIVNPSARVDEEQLANITAQKQAFFLRGL